MIINPFQLLEIEPTINKEIINQAYQRLADKGAPDDQMEKLNAAHRECLLYAESDGGIEIFTHHKN